MTTNTDTFTGLVTQIVLRAMRYMVPREGEVVDVTDPVNKGRVLAIIPALGWFTPDSGLWCYPADKNAVTTPAVGDRIIIQFVGGDPLHPIYIGQSNRIDGQLPEHFEGPDTHVVFEDPQDRINMTYDGAVNELEIGNSDFRNSARVDDTTISSSAEDTTFWAFWDAVFGVITGPDILTGSSGNPNTLQVALRTAITGAGGTPSSITGRISSGSSQVKVGDA